MVALCQAPGLCSLYALSQLVLVTALRVSNIIFEFIDEEGRRGTPLFVKLLRNPEEAFLSILQFLGLDLPTFLLECGFIIEK